MKSIKSGWKSLQVRLGWGSMKLASPPTNCVFEVSDTANGSIELVVPKSEEEGATRDQWKRRFDFVLACVGLSVGLGNVWRFPYLCYKNGGGAFLIPYFICVLVAGFPLFLLEVTLGQMTSRGGIAAWNICPLFRGIGFATSVTSFSLNCYYNVILAWALYYLFGSFTWTLPWAECGQGWNTDKCMDEANRSFFRKNNISLGDQIYLDPSVEYWERRVLGITTGIENMGKIKWELALCLLLSWIIVFLCIFKGIKTSGKVMYVTATAPYLFMFILLVRVVTLDGAADGLSYYITPVWSKLKDLRIWADAGGQIFFSYSISLGTLTAMGSYNPFHHNSFRDCVIYACVNTFTSLLAGLIVFGTLGHMAKESHQSIDAVAESGPGLAFVIYPKALGMMPASPFWSVCFFLMILLLGIDSQFAGVEGFITAITDFYPRLVLNPRFRVAFVGSVCLTCYLVGLSMVTEGGMYLFQLLNHYAASLIILLTAFFECIVVGYFYGAKRITRNMRRMHGWTLHPLPTIFWCVISPCATLVLFLFSVIVYEELTYERAAKTIKYEFPSWAVRLGWSIASCSVIMIPIVMIVQLIRTPGTFFERFKVLCQPDLDEKQRSRLESYPTVVNCFNETPAESLNHVNSLKLTPVNTNAGPITRLTSNIGESNLDNQGNT